MPSLTCLRVCKIWQKIALCDSSTLLCRGGSECLIFIVVDRCPLFRLHSSLVQRPPLKKISTPQAAETGDQPALKVRILVAPDRFLSFSLPLTAKEKAGEPFIQPQPPIPFPSGEAGNAVAERASQPGRT